MAKKERVFDRGTPIPSWFPIVLGILTAVGPVSTDIYLPALPEMERQLHAPAGSGGATMAAWVIGLAIGQITIGPISDRFGRRLPLMIGMIGYTIGALGCTVATSMWEMCAFRVFAAIMASAGLVVPNACIRDLTEGDESSRLMSRLIVIQGAVPILAPMLGGLALKFVTWRDIFLATTLYGGVCVIFLTILFPETLPKAGRQDLRLMPIVYRYIRISTDRSFFTNGLICALQGFVTFTYLTAAPMLFEDIFGMSPFHYGMLFGVFAVCMIGASQINGMLVGRVSNGKMLFGALTVSVAGAVALLAVTIYASLNPDASGHMRMGFMWPIIILMIITMAPNGIIGPNAIVGALSNQAETAGSASALVGTFQYVMGALASAMFAFLPTGTAVPMAVMFLLPLVGMMIAGLLRPKLPSSAEAADLLLAGENHR